MGTERVATTESSMSLAFAAQLSHIWLPTTTSAERCTLHPGRRGAKSLDAERCTRKIPLNRTDDAGDGGVGGLFPPAVIHLSHLPLVADRKKLPTPNVLGYRSPKRERLRRASMSGTNHDRSHHSPRPPRSLAASLALGRSAFIVLRSALFEASAWWDPRQSTGKSAGSAV